MFFIGMIYTVCLYIQVGKERSYLVLAEVQRMYPSFLYSFRVLHLVLDIWGYV